MAVRQPVIALLQNVRFGDRCSGETRCDGDKHHVAISEKSEWITAGQRPRYRPRKGAWLKRSNGVVRPHKNVQFHDFFIDAQLFQEPRESENLCTGVLGVLPGNIDLRILREVDAPLPYSPGQFIIRITAVNYAR